MLRNNNLIGFGVSGQKFPKPPENFGDSFEGGYYAGNVLKSDGIHAIIVSPKAQGENGGATILYRTSQAENPGTRSLVEGLNNSNAMNSGLYPAASYCRSLNIGGYDDWYLPARDELELCYRNLKPTTELNQFQNREKSAYVYSPLDDEPSDIMGYNRYSLPQFSGYSASVPSQTISNNFKNTGSEFFIDNYYWSSTESSSTDVWFMFFNTGGQSLGFRQFGKFVRAIRSVRIA